MSNTKKIKVIVLIILICHSISYMCGCNNKVNGDITSAK